jgi:glycosyltransferase involved in cell wall biosynthesis
VAAGEVTAIRRSVDALAVHTPQPVTVVQLARAGAYGFNELITYQADVIVLLEAGAIVAPRWLELLTAALARPGVGLAGPSTNRAGNEQACVDAGAEHLQAVRRDAAWLGRRYGSAARTLTPAYSLDDFCYAVRREVVDAIGEADPAYDEGAGWGVDYNIRAARAGFAGLWVSGAYVCRTGPVPDPMPVVRRVAPPPIPSPPGALPERSPMLVAPRAPLISCVMPTGNRLGLAAQAVRYFLTQDYPNAELVVVNDGDGDLVARLPADPRIRVVHSNGAVGRHTIGALRNTGCAAAHGDVIVLWADDDWHGPTRASDQVRPILAGAADVTGLADLEWFEPVTWRAWRLTPELRRRLVRRNVLGGTIAFRRSLWRRLPFPDRSLAEDAEFLDAAVRSGARLLRLDGANRYVCIRHEHDNQQLTPGQPGLRAGWTPVPVPALPAQDLAFYAGLAPPGRSWDANPLISCIMPTHNRRAFVAKAIEYFLRQDYPAKELVILDDGDDPVGDLVPEVAGIHYHRLEQRTVLGAKRNLACELAQGVLIAHWDDDDWQAPRRLSLQAARLNDGKADLCGAGSLLFWDPPGNQAWRYTWPNGRRGWAAGTSLCYPRSVWQRTPFSEVPTGEDTRFIWQSVVRRLADVRDENCVVGLVHAANTVPKTGRGAYWARAGISEVTRCLGSDVEFYQGLRRTPQVASAASG